MKSLKKIQKRQKKKKAEKRNKEYVRQIQSKLSDDRFNHNHINNYINY